MPETKPPTVLKLEDILALGPSFERIDPKEFVRVNPKTMLEALCLMHLDGTRITYLIHRLRTAAAMRDCLIDGDKLAPTAISLDHLDRLLVRVLGLEPKAVEAVSDAVLPSPRPEWATRGGRLRYARQNAGLSIGQVGALLGIKGATVRTWEDGEEDPGPSILDCLGEYYGTATAFLESGAVAIIPPSLRATLRLLPDDEARAVIDLLSTLRSGVSP